MMLAALAVPPWATADEGRECTQSPSPSPVQGMQGSGAAAGASGEGFTVLGQEATAEPTGETRCTSAVGVSQPQFVVQEACPEAATAVRPCVAEPCPPGETSMVQYP